MTHVTIIGTGNMGQAIAGVVTKGGNTAELIGHSDSAKPVTGQIVVLAVPYPAVADILATRGDQLAGKMVVDITNPLNYETFDSLTVPADSSAAAQIAATLPALHDRQGVQHDIRRHPGLRHRRRGTHHRPDCR